MKTPNTVPQSDCMYGDSMEGGEWGGGGGQSNNCTATVMMQKCFLTGFTSAG